MRFFCLILLIGTVNIFTLYLNFVYTTLNARSTCESHNDVAHHHWGNVKFINRNIKRCRGYAKNSIY